MSRGECEKWRKKKVVISRSCICGIRPPQINEPFNLFRLFWLRYTRNYYNGFCFYILISFCMCCILLYIFFLPIFHFQYVNVTCNGSAFITSRTRNSSLYLFFVQLFDIFSLFHRLITT